MEQPNFTEAPALAVKLSPSGQKQQQSNPKFLASFIQNIIAGTGITPIVEPVVTPESSDGVAQKVALATKLDPNYQPTDFSAWFEVTFEDRRKELKDEAVPAWFPKVFSTLANIDEVENLHLLVLQPPPAIDVTGDILVPRQGYLGPAPAGIDARFAWTVAGGDGAGASLIDVEQGWNWNHADLVSGVANTSHGGS